MNEHEQSREKMALFRFSVIGSLTSAELAHGDLNPSPTTIKMF